METKKIKKVCFFSPASYPFFYPGSDVSHGGAELQMYLWAKSLLKNQDFQIYFLTEKHKQEKPLKQSDIKLIRTIKLKNNEFILSKLLKSIKYFFQLLKLNPDVIICTNANAILGITGFYAKLFHKKFIYRTSSEIDVNKKYILQNSFSGKLYEYGLKKASKVITQNKEHQNLLKINHNIDAFILKNFFEIKKTDLPEKKFILWVSRFAEMKNPDLFLIAAKKIPEYKFVMICPYKISDKRNWTKLKLRAEKITNLTLIEKVPFPEIQKYFNKALLFVNTSDFEGFPNTFLQAAQGKTPIVSLNVNPDNFINEYDCGIFAEGNFENLISGIKDLSENENMRKLKANNLFRYLKENHNIEKNGQKLNEIIEQMI